MKNEQKWLCTSRILEPKNKVRGTEDGLYFGNRWFAVVDGVSIGVSPNAGAPLLDTETPGQFARNVGLAALREAEREGLTVDQIVPFLTERLRKEVSRLWRGTSIIGPGFTLSAFLPGEEEGEDGVILRVGDCPYLIDGEGHNPGLPFDNYKAAIRKELLERLVAKGYSEQELLLNDPTAGEMDRLTQNEQPKYRNKDHPEYAYGVVNGETVPVSCTERFVVPARAKGVVLATDGYPPHVIRDSAEETHMELLALLKRDRLCYKEWVAVRGVYPGYMIPDDASGLWLQRA